MRNLELTKLETINGGDIGDAVDGFCAGYGIVAGTYAIGVAINLWNPVGWLGGLVGGVVAAGCAINAMT